MYDSVECQIADPLVEQLGRTSPISAVGFRAARVKQPSHQTVHAYVVEDYRHSCVRLRLRFRRGSSVMPERFLDV
jgi:hypothetical protein